MIKFNHPLFFLFFLFTLSAFGQAKKLTALEVLKKASDHFKHSDYVSYNTTYTLFKDFTSQEVIENFSGIIIKKNQVYYFKLKDTEFITVENIGLKINHQQKALVIEKNPTEKESFQLNLEQYSKGFTSKITETDKQYICAFTPVKLSQIMITKALIYINKADFSIAKQIVYTANNKGFVDGNSKNKVEVPRLEIIFQKRLASPKDDELTKKENYFTLKGKEVILNSKWDAYTKFNL